MSELTIESYKIGSREVRVYLKPGSAVDVHTHNSEGALIRALSFKIGDLAVMRRFWVDSDGPMEGYAEITTARIKNVGRSYITFDAEVTPKSRRLGIREFASKNWNEVCNPR